MSSNNGSEYGAVRRCVAELEEMWLSVPDARNTAAEVPSFDPTLAGIADPGAFLAHPWEQTSTGQLLGPGGVHVMTGMRNWLQGMLRSAEVERQHAEALYKRWERDPQAHGVVSLPEARAGLLERLEQTVAGLALTIGDERPEGNEGAEFRIAWQPDGDGLGCWEGAPAAAAFSLREAAEDNAELLGEYPHALVAPVAELLLRDLRQGQLILPLLSRSERSTHNTTWLRWGQFGATEERRLLLPEVHEQAPGASAEEVLRRHVPELACLYDEALALSAHGLDLNEPVLVDPDDAPTPIDNGRVAFAAQLVAQLQRLTGLPAETLVRALTLPLQVIVRLSVQASVQRRARILLEALRGAFN